MKTLYVLSISLLLSVNLNAMWAIRAACAAVTPAQQTTFSDLPDEVVAHIATFMPNHGVHSLHNVNRRCRTLVENVCPEKLEHSCACSDEMCKININLRLKQLLTEKLNKLAPHVETLNALLACKRCTLSEKKAIRNFVLKQTNDILTLITNYWEPFGRSLLCEQAHDVMPDAVERYPLLTFAMFPKCYANHNEVAQVEYWFNHQMAKAIANKPETYFQSALCLWSLICNCVNSYLYPQDNTTTFNDLPDIALERIASCLTNHDIHNLRLTNKQCARIAAPRSHHNCVVCYFGLDTPPQTRLKNICINNQVNPAQ